MAIYYIRRRSVVFLNGRNQHFFFFIYRVLASRVESANDHTPGDVCNTVYKEYHIRTCRTSVQMFRFASLDRVKYTRGVMCI